MATVDDLQQQLQAMLQERDALREERDREVAAKQQATEAVIAATSELKAAQQRLAEDAERLRRAADLAAAQTETQQQTGATGTPSITEQQSVDDQPQGEISELLNWLKLFKQQQEQLRQLSPLDSASGSASSSGASIGQLTTAHAQQTSIVEQRSSRIPAKDEAATLPKFTGDSDSIPIEKWVRTIDEHYNSWEHYTRRL